MRTVAIILAGGGGNRLWPLSTEKHPKMLLEIFHNKSMLEEAVFRAKLFTEDIFLLTKMEIYEAAKEELSANGIGRTQVIIEPKHADTAAAIAYATAHIKKLYGPEVVLVLTPSDSRIKNYGAYYRDMNYAIRAAKKQKSPTLFGVTPTFPATGYGYIKVGKKLGEDDRETLFAIDSFHEKPNQETAKKYVTNGDYLWNSGIIIGLVTTFEHVFTIDQELHRWYKRLLSSESTIPMPKKFEEFQFEHELLQKYSKLCVVIATFDWADIGTFEALYDVSAATDEHGNSVNANSSIEDCKDCLIIGRGKKIVALGLNDIAIIDQPDGILICRKSTHSELVGKIATGESQPGS